MLSRSQDDSESKYLADVVDGLFLMDSTSRLVFYGDDKSKSVLVVDIKLIDRIVQYLYSMFNAAAKTVYRGIVKTPVAYGRQTKQAETQIGAPNEPFCPSVSSRHIKTALS